MKKKDSGISKIRLVSTSPDDTLKIGRIIAGCLSKGDIICLFGDLGSGKTVLTKGIARGLGIKVEEIISPTFVLIQRHLQSKFPVYHFDLYRMNAPKEIINLGYEEYFFGDGVSVIEWAERLKYLLPKDCLRVKLQVKGKDKRLLEFSASGARHKELLRLIKGKI